MPFSKQYCSSTDEIWLRELLLIVVIIETNSINAMQSKKKRRVNDFFNEHSEYSELTQSGQNEQMSQKLAHVLNQAK